MKQAQRVAKELPAETLDMLFLSSGSEPTKQRVESSEGIEQDLAISYLSRFVIVHGVADRLGAKRGGKSLKPRIFSLAGPGVGIIGDASDLNAERTNGFWVAHMNTVAGNEAIVLDGASRYPAINFYGLNPGMFKTDIRSHFLGKGSIKHRLVEALRNSSWPPDWLNGR